jgi:hypothetical protein
LSIYFSYFVFDPLAIVLRLCFECTIRQVHENWVKLKLNGTRIAVSAECVNLLGETHKKNTQAI